MQLIRPLLHVSAIALLYYLAYRIRSVTSVFGTIDIGTPWVATQELFLYVIVSLIIFVITGIIAQRYDLISFNNLSTQKFLKVRSQWTIVATWLAYFGQWWIFDAGISRFIIVVVALASLFVLPLLDQIWKKLYTHILKQSALSIRVLLQDVDQRIITTQLNFPDHFSVSTSLFDTTTLHNLTEDIIVLIGSYDKDKLQELIDLMRLTNKQLYHIGSNYFLEDIIYTHTKFAWTMALRYTSSQIEGRSAIFKRIFDVFGSIVGIIITSPLMLLSALAIKFDSTWPVFYRQSRVWKNGQEFLFTKFRTMYTHLSVGEEYGGNKAEQLYQDLVNSHANIRKGELPKIKDDPRVTNVGKFLRATSIDELPNLFAVLVGDMSLIGPRPHLPSEIKNYKPWQQRVLSIKPWITWYAQIFGRDSLSFDEEATKELEYIQNRSLWLDMYIIIMTFGVVFGGKGK